MRVNSSGLRCVILPPFDGLFKPISREPGRDAIPARGFACRLRAVEDPPVPDQEDAPHGAPGEPPAIAATEPPPRAPLPPPPGILPLDRLRAALEVFLVTLGVGFLIEALARARLGGSGDLTDLGSGAFALLLILQNFLALVLIARFLRMEGRGLGYLGYGRGRPAREALLGLLLFPPILVGSGLAQLGLQGLFPGLRTVEANPLIEMIRSPADVALFVVMSLLAGGVGEESIRAFVLRRFESHLGGIGWGLAIWSVGFGALHLIQGLDKAIVVGMLGLAFGLVYAWRRSPIAPIVVHAAFDVFQTVAAYLAQRA